MVNLSDVRRHPLKRCAATMSGRQSGSMEDTRKG